MTEQPVETEQQFLGNETADAVQNLVDDINAGVVPLAEMRQHYSPNAHLLRPGSVDNVELGALARTASHAAKLLAIAKAESVKAEEALQLALKVEHEANLTFREAEMAVRNFIVKDSGL